MPVDQKNWQYALESLAVELYELSHQLQDKVAVSDFDNPRSHSLPHPNHSGQQSKPLSPAEPAGEDGAWNGKESIEPVA